MTDEPGGDLGAACHVQPVEEVGEVVLDGLLAQLELRADLFVCEAIAQKGEHLMMSWGEVRIQPLRGLHLPADPFHGSTHEGRVKGRLSVQRLSDDSWYLIRQDRFQNESQRARLYRVHDQLRVSRSGDEHDSQAWVLAEEDAAEIDPVPI